MAQRRPPTQEYHVAPTRQDHTLSDVDGQSVTTPSLQEKMAQRRDKRSSSFRLTDEAFTLLARIAEHQGITQSAVLELLIRREAEHLGLRPTSKP
jgi:hypothetical protein